MDAQVGPGDAEDRHARIGVEVEFTGLSARDAIVALQAGLGGEIFEEDPHAYQLKASRIGDFWVELDLRHAHPQRHGAMLTFNPGRKFAALFGTLASPFAPREMVFPPRPADKLSDIDDAVRLLHDAGATGDGSILLDTLGLHFNISTRAEDIAHIRATTLAFARLDPAIRAQIAPDRAMGAARLAPPYPADYVRHLEASAPTQDIGAFIDDYLAMNPTRDRALDLLPLLLHLDGPRVRRRLPYEKISARPVFHWRLPLARVGRANWSILPSWRLWLDVEAAAADILARV